MTKFPYLDDLRLSFRLETSPVKVLVQDRIGKIRKRLFLMVEMDRKLNFCGKPIAQYRKLMNPIRRSLLFLFLVGVQLHAADWPTYQHDNGRTGVTSEALSLPLLESWVFDPVFPPVKGWPPPVVGYGAYKNKSNVDYDDAYHVTSVDGRVYFSASAENRVYALDADSGKILWTFFTDAAPRLAPAIWEGHTYFGADDGKAYCLDAATGKLLWQFDAAPGVGQLLGQGRIGSGRPVRTGVLVDVGTAYFAAGLFPSEGIYLFALDAGNGKERWRKMLDDRGNEAPSPQGYLLADDKSLFITSRVAPTRWSREDGQEMPFITPLPLVKSDAYRYHNGGSYALLWDNRNIVYGQAALLAYDPDKELKDKYNRTVKGERLFNWFNARRMVFQGKRAWLSTDYHLVCVDTDQLPALSENECLDFEEAYKKHRVATCLAGLEEIAKYGEDSARGQAIKNGNLKYSMRDYEKWPEVSAKLFEKFEAKTNWMTRSNASESMVLAGDVLYAGGETGIVAVDSSDGRILWQAETGSRVRGLAVAGQKLFASTIDGRVRCFVPGTKQREPARVVSSDGSAVKLDAKAKGIVSAALAGAPENVAGYALVIGSDPAVAVGLAEATSLRIKMLVPNPERLPALRDTLARAGWYGGRITASLMPAKELPYPPYLFNFVIDLGDTHTVPSSELFRVARPFGGVVLLAGFNSAAAPQEMGFQSEKTGAGDRFVRGSLPGAKNWTHNHGSPANRQCSEDSLVQGPFGILWYGEPGPRQRIERHATPPMPLVVDGIMFLEGYDLLMAYDVYNGTQYWERWIPGVTRQGLPVGTSNLVADGQYLYAVAENARCLQLDRLTGLTVREFPAPQLPGNDHHYWGWIAKEGNLLFGSRADHDTRRRQAKHDSNHAVFALDSSSGKLQWIREGQGIDNDSIAMDNGILFFVDRNLTETEKAAALAETVKDNSVKNRPAVDRKGNPIPPDLRKIVALDSTTGAELWTKPFNFTDITLDDSALGSHIGHSVLCMVRDGILVLSGQGSLGHPYREYKAGEFARRAIYALDTKTGKLLWGGRRNYRKRPVIVGDEIYAEPHAWKLKTGEPLLTVNPLTGEPIPLDFLRGYSGCGHLVASGAALFGNAGSGGMAHYNLSQPDGYTPLGNLQLSCGMGAVPAGGVFIAPEGRSGCTCATPIHTSVVLYPVGKPSDAWSFGAGGAETLECLPVRQVAVNFGAPGFRTDPSGQLWLPYAGKGLYGQYSGWLPSYQHQPEMFYADSPDILPVSDTSIPWVYSSGYTGEKDLVFPMLDPKKHKPASYSVRLHFAEPKDLEPGDRVFELSIQGKPVLPALDIRARSGQPRKAYIEEFQGIPVKDTLRITLKNSGGTLPPILCAFEARQE